MITDEEKARLVKVLRCRVDEIENGTIPIKEFVSGWCMCITVAFAEVANEDPRTVVFNGLAADLLGED